MTEKWPDPALDEFERERSKLEAAIAVARARAAAARDMLQTREATVKACTSIQRRSGGVGGVYPIAPGYALAVNGTYTERAPSGANLQISTARRACAADSTSGMTMPMAPASRMRAASRSSKARTRTIGVTPQPSAASEIAEDRKSTR